MFKIKNSFTKKKYFSEEEYFNSYKAGLAATPYIFHDYGKFVFPFLKGKYIYTLEDLFFAHKEGLKGHPRPQKKRRGKNV